MRQIFLPFHVPEIGDREVEAVAETLRSGWLSTGSKPHAFETEFAKFLGADHAIAVNSCTAALHLASSGAWLASLLGSQDRIHSSISLPAERPAGKPTSSPPPGRH